MIDEATDLENLNAAEIILQRASAGTLDGTTTSSVAGMATAEGAHELADEAARMRVSAKPYDQEHGGL